MIFEIFWLHLHVVTKSTTTLNEVNFMRNNLYHL